MFLHRYVKILAVLTLGLIIVGGIVHNTGSSLACPDWPTCYGTFMPEMKGGVAIEHSHRLFAASVGLLTIILCILLWKRMRGIGIVALSLVVFQGLLGGITVLFKLPAFVSTAHLATSFLFLAILLVIAQRTSLNSGSPAVRRGAKWVIVATIFVYVQSLLGAIVRHTESGLVCPDIPFCYGSLWPVGEHPSLLLHMAHRWMGVFVAGLVLPLPLILRKQENRKIRLLSWLAPLLVLGQITLGLLSVWTHLGIAAVTAHLGGAALLWGTMVSLWLKFPSPSTDSEDVVSLSRDGRGVNDSPLSPRREREFASAVTVAGEGSVVAP